MSGLTPAVEQAVDQIREQLSGCGLAIETDNDGGAIVVITGVDLGYPYKQDKTWFGFHITFQYPSADVYPHFTHCDLARVDGKILGEGFANAVFQDKPAIQISRRSNRLNPAHDTAVLKLQKVINWMKGQL